MKIGEALTLLKLSVLAEQSQVVVLYKSLLRKVKEYNDVACSAFVISSRLGLPQHDDVSIGNLLFLVVCLVLM